MKRVWRMPLMRVLLVAAIVTINTVCAGPFTPPAPPMGPEEYCATQLPANSYGNAFYCGTSVAALANKVSFPDGSRGFCMYADTNLSITGYVAYTSSGGAGMVTTQSNASSQCSWWNSGGLGCPGIIRCTRQ